MEANEMKSESEIIRELANVFTRMGYRVELEGNIQGVRPDLIVYKNREPILVVEVKASPLKFLPPTVLHQVKNIQAKMPSAKVMICTTSQVSPNLKKILDEERVPVVKIKGWPIKRNLTIDLKEAFENVGLEFPEDLNISRNKNKKKIEK